MRGGNGNQDDPVPPWDIVPPDDDQHMCWVPEGFDKPYPKGPSKIEDGSGEYAIETLPPEVRRRIKRFEPRFQFTASGPTDQGADSVVEEDSDANRLATQHVPLL